MVTDSDFLLWMFLVLTELKIFTAYQFSLLIISVNICSEKQRKLIYFQKNPNPDPKLLIPQQVLYFAPLFIFALKKDSMYS